MRVTGIDNRSIAASSRMRPAAQNASSESASAAETSSSRALVPVAPVVSSNRTSTVVRQPVGFLAHLIATEQALPQTRERRRVEPQFGVAIYAEAVKHAPAMPFHALSRAM